MEEIRVLSQPFPGYGIQKKSMELGFRDGADVLVCQGTSTDMGPYYMATGKPFVGQTALKQDMKVLLSLALEHNVTFIASLIGAGSDIDLNRSLDVIDEIAREMNLNFKAAVISGEIDKEWLKDKLRNGAKTKRLAPHPQLVEELTEAEIDRSVRVLAQMGLEPIIAALNTGVKCVFTGRALDAGLIAAMPVKEGFDPGLAFHMAKVIECGSLSATPPAVTDPQFAILRKDHFMVRPPNPARKCTTISCAGHAFYERSNPFKEENPGGYLDITKANYEQYDERTVKISGSRWVPTKYTIKVEGAALTGYRTISIGGMRCPVAISKIDYIIPSVTEFIKNQLSGYGVTENDYRLLFRIYGKDGVMKSWEPQESTASHELCVIIDVVANTQELANDVCALARSAFLHWYFPGRIATAGNMAFPYSPSDTEQGGVYEFNIFHTIEIDDPVEPFPFKIVEFPRR